MGGVKGRRGAACRPNPGAPRLAAPCPRHTTYSGTPPLPSPSQLLARRPARFDDAAGPGALVALTVVAGGATLALAFARAAGA